VDGFVLILAIIVFSVFKNVMQEVKKKQGSSSLPDVFDTIAEHDDSKDRAREALRRWEAKQRSLPSPQPEGPTGTSPGSARIPRSGEHRTDLRLSSPGRLQQETSRQQNSWRQSAQRGGRPLPEGRRTKFAPPAAQADDAAERTRQEAYDAIRQLLGGQSRRPEPMDGGNLPARRPARVPTIRTDAVPTRRPRIQGTVARRREEEARRTEANSPRTVQAESGRGASAPGLERLDRLPPVARGILYAELLGTPLGLREPRQVIGD